MLESDDYVRVAAEHEVPPGALVQVEVDGMTLVVGNNGGELFALSGRCSHEGAELRMGSVHEHVLTCFAHQWTYNVKTGDPIWPPIARIAPGYRLRTFRVRIEDGSILVSRRPARLGLG